MNESKMYKYSSYRAVAGELQLTLISRGFSTQKHRKTKVFARLKVSITALQLPANTSVRSWLARSCMCEYSCDVLLSLPHTAAFSLNSFLIQLNFKDAESERNWRKNVNRGTVESPLGAIRLWRCVWRWIREEKHFSNYQASKDLRTRSAEWRKRNVEKSRVEIL